MENKEYCVTVYGMELDNGKPSLVAESQVLNTYGNLIEPKRVFAFLNEVFHFDRKAEENVYLIALNSKCEALGIFPVSQGTVSVTILTPREPFIRLLLCGASGFFIAHNHPSGDPTPSKEDLEITKRLAEAGNLMGIPLIDHIICGKSYCSLREQGVIKG